jgi:hypothetical protein
MLGVSRFIERPVSRPLTNLTPVPMYSGYYPSVKLFGSVRDSAVMGSLLGRALLTKPDLIRRHNG